MKNVIKIFGIAALLVVIVFSVAACKGRNAPANETAVISSNATDQLLDEYEQFVDQFLALYERMMAGDLTAMEEIDVISAEAEAWGEMLGDIDESDFTEAQENRLIELTEKYVSIFY